MDCSPTSCSVHGISQARILKLVIISFSRGSCLLHCRQVLYHWARREGNKEMESTRIPGEDQPNLSGVVGKQDAVGRRGLMFTKQEKGYRYSLQTCMHVCTNMYVCVYTHVYTWFYSIWNVSKAEVEVEDMDAPWMEGWMLLWAGRKLGHAEDGKPVTGEMIIVLLNVNYPWI